jgi:hypothetical protein
MKKRYQNINFEKIPADVKELFETIQADTNNFTNQAAIEMHQANFNRLFEFVKDKFPGALIAKKEAENYEDWTILNFDSKEKGKEFHKIALKNLGCLNFSIEQLGNHPHFGYQDKYYVKHIDDLELLNELYDKYNPELKSDQPSVETGTKPEAKKTPVLAKEPWQMTFDQFWSKVVLRIQPHDAKIEIWLKSDGVEEIIGNFQGTNSSKEDTYNMLQLEKLHYNKVLKALSDGEKVDKSITDFYLSDYSLIYKNYGSASLKKQLNTDNPEKNDIAEKELKYPHPAIEKLKQAYDNTKNDFERKNLAFNFSATFAGDSNRKIRQEIMTAIKGEKVPVAKCGVHALEEEFKKFISGFEKPELKKNQSDKEYTYALIYRPFDIGTYPDQNFIRFDDNNKYPFGMLVYSSPLSIDMMNKYQLSPISEIENLDNKKIDYYDGLLASLKIVRNSKNIPFVEATMFDENNKEIERETIPGISFLSSIERGKYKIINTENNNRSYDKQKIENDYLRSIGFSNPQKSRFHSTDGQQNIDVSIAISDKHKKLAIAYFVQADEQPVSKKILRSIKVGLKPDFANYFYTNAGLEIHSKEMDGNSFEGIKIVKVPFDKFIESQKSDQPSVETGTKPEAKKTPVLAKEPWQMTFEEFKNSSISNKINKVGIGASAIEKKNNYIFYGEFKRPSLKKEHQTYRKYYSKEIYLLTAKYDIYDQLKTEAEKKGLTKNIIEDFIKQAGSGIANIQSKQAKADNYQKLLEKYEDKPSDELKKKIVKLEKELEYTTSYFELNENNEIQSKLEVFRMMLEMADNDAEKEKIQTKIDVFEMMLENN